MKECKTCKTYKPLDKFQKGVAYKDGHRPVCKTCRNIEVQQYRIKTGRTAGTIRKKGTFRDKADQKTFYKYGIQSSDVFKMFVGQLGVCKICRQGPESTRNNGHKYLAVDHCHTTGVVRGLLCMSCNTALGQLGDSTELLRRAITYLEQQ